MDEGNRKGEEWKQEAKGEGGRKKKKQPNDVTLCRFLKDL